jgi:hypothetical protein
MRAIVGGARVGGARVGGARVGGARVIIAAAIDISAAIMGIVETTIRTIATYLTEGYSKIVKSSCMHPFNIEAIISISIYGV